MTDRARGALPAVAAKGTRLIDGDTRLMGVLGESIAYTRSPAMHNAAAAALGINAAYMALSLPKAELQAFLDVAWHLGALGFNVTTPHKEAVAKLVPGSGLSSVNTLYRGKSWWEAASTDGEGFALGLARLGRPWASFRRLVLLGSGGASVALLTYLGVTGLNPEITVLRRGGSKDRDQALTAAAAQLREGSFRDLNVAELTRALAGAGPDTLLVQATSAPQRGDDLAALVPALQGFGGVVADLVYGKPSALYFAAMARDLTAQDGEAMLIEQARLSQRLWWGKAARYEELALALRGKE